MFNLADILAQAQSNPGFDTFSRQFGMTPDQVKAAMDALLPAFSVGLNRAAQSPLDLANLFGLYATQPNVAQMFENPAGAASAMMMAGQEAVNRIFGSNELAQAIAAQTAGMTGMGQEMMKQVMPMMAAMLMGGLMQGAMNGQNPLGALISATLSRLGAPMAPGTADPLGGMMGMFSNFFAAANQPKPAATSGIPGFDQLMDMARQLQAANPLMQPPAPAAGAEASGPRTIGQQAADTWTATMGRMFETGREMQDQQLAQIEKIFADFGRAPTGGPQSGT